VDAADWLVDLLDVKNRNKLVNQAIRTLKKMADKFDFIAFRGNSGALIAIPVAYKLKKQLTVIRKENREQRHSGRDVEGVTTGRYFIMDDFISSGKTIEEIVKMLPYAQCVGIWLYRQNKCNTPYFYNVYQRDPLGCCVKDKDGEWIISQKIPVYNRFGAPAIEVV
jgi:hypothetical protein